MPRKGEGKWQALLKDGDVQRWYDNLARGSPATADNYLRVLGRFLAGNGLTPKAFLRLRAKRRDDLLADHITHMAEAGRAGSYIEVTKKSVASWLNWNGQRITRKIRVPGASQRPALRDAHIPTQEELRRVLNVAGGPKARTAIALMAFSGLRPETMGTYLGDDGLRIGDFAEATVEEGVLTFSTVPAMILVPERLSKTGRPYFTFLGPEGCDYLVAYVRQRAEAGERVSERSPLITPLKVKKDFIRSLNIGNLIRKPMRAAGLKEPPYIWRSYFASRAMLAEGRGLSRDYREFMMGHKGDIAHVYALHKKLPPDTVETMRHAYETALEFLETRPAARKVDRIRLAGPGPSLRAEDLDDELRRMQALGFGTALRGVLWFPGSERDVEARVTDEWIRVYVKDLSEAARVVRHEVLHYEVAQCQLPYVELVNAFISGVGKEAYRRTEKLVEKLVGLEG